MPKRKTVIHVLPLNDLREHRESKRCRCSPRCEVHSNGTVVIHNSMDGREMIERHGLQ